MDAKKIIESIGAGIISVPDDFYLGIERYFQNLSGSKSFRNGIEDVRFFSALNKLKKHRYIIKEIAEIIIDDALTYLPDSALQKIKNKLLAGVSGILTRKGIQLAISSYIGVKLTDRIMYSALIKRLIKAGSGITLSGVMLYGIIARAGVSSRKLREKNHHLWGKLYVNDVEMLYFLFEKPLENFIKIGTAFRMGSDETKELLSEIENL